MGLCISSKPAKECYCWSMNHALRIKGLEQAMVLSEEQWVMFLPPGGHLALSGDFFVVVVITTRKRGCH